MNIFICFLSKISICLQSQTKKCLIAVLIYTNQWQTFTVSRTGVSLESGQKSLFIIISSKLLQFISTQKCVGLHCVMPLSFSGSPFICQSLSGGSWVIRSVWSWKETNSQIYARVVLSFPFKHASCISRISCQRCSFLGCRLQVYFTIFWPIFLQMLPQISSMLQNSGPWAEAHHINYYK